LTRIALDKVAHCTAGRQSYDRVVASCTIAGRPVGGLMRAAGTPKGGRGYLHAGSRSAPRANAAPEPVVVEQSSAFHSCREARAAGAAPMYRGQPGYNPALDGDGDGIACEPYDRR
jgi:hypothetical protein